MTVLTNMRRLLSRKPAPPEVPLPVELGWPAGHYYSPLPDLADIRNRESVIFGPPRDALPGIALNEKRQLQLLEELERFYPEMPFTSHKQDGLRYYFDNPNFRHGEAIVLYGMIRLLRPKRIIEIGSGFSSCVILDTNERFFDGTISCTFVEPHPRQLLSLLTPEDSARLQLLERKVYDLDLDLFTQLEAGDILFVDSSHVSKVGSDVNDIFFRILPSLKPGVYIHFHDIPHDFEYPREWVFEGRAWNEAYILRAFLQFNHSFSIEFFNSFMWEFHRESLVASLPLVERTQGTSIWLKKTDT